MMRTYKGVVCEKKNSYMLFLTKEGEFLRGIPVSGTPEVGEDVEFHLFVASHKVRAIQSRYFKPVLAVAALFIIIMSSLIPQPNNVMAYVQLTSESDLEIGIDQEGNVVNYRYWDDNPPVSRKMLDDWTGLPIEVVLEEVLKNLPKINNEEAVGITAIFSSDINVETKEIVRRSISNVRSKHTGASLNVSERTVDEREKANEMNVPIYKFIETNEDKPKSLQSPSLKKENQNQDQTPKKQDAPKQVEQKKPEEKGANRNSQDMQSKPETEKQAEAKQQPSGLKNKEPESKKDNSSNKNPSKSNEGNESNKGNKGNNPSTNDNQKDKDPKRPNPQSKENNGNSK